MTAHGHGHPHGHGPNRPRGGGLSDTRAALLGLERPGVRVTGVLPDPDWAGRWHDIIVAPELKTRLLNLGLLSLTQRGAATGVGRPWHGLALLSGPPGTGKTTLAHGLAHAVAEVLAQRELAATTLFASVDPHAFPSEYLGESQRATARLFSHSLPEIAAQGHPVVVLLDEVEALAVSRAEASAGTNPIDVHRATDAVLTGLDDLGRRCPNVFVVATTNSSGLVDEAFLSRVDLHERFALPPAAVVVAILLDSLAQIGVAVAPGDERVTEVAQRCVAAGIDPRQVRKLVLHALVNAEQDVALAPETLDVGRLLDVLPDRSGRQEFSTG